MDIRSAAADPWMLLVGGTAAGLAWAVTLPVAAIAGIGVAVWGVGVGASALLNKDEKGETVQIDVNSAAGMWLQRAKDALAELDEIAGTTENVLRMQADEVVERAQATTGTLERIGLQVQAVETALMRVDRRYVEHELQRVNYDLSRTRPSARGDMEQAASHLSTQLEVADRLENAHALLLARLQSATIGVEGLVARLAEIVAVSSGTGVDTSADRLHGLADELEGLRCGLVETEALSNKTLNAVPEA